MAKAPNKGSERARRYDRIRTFRAIVFSIVVAPLLVALVWWLASPPTPTPPPLTKWGATPAFSMLDTMEELTKAFDDSVSKTGASYLERERIATLLETMRVEYGKGIYSKAQLEQAIEDLLSTLDDRYARLMSPQEYEDMTARKEGKTIGINLGLSQDADTEAWLVRSVGPEAERAGLQAGDEIISVETFHIAQIAKRGWPPEIIGKLLNNGLLGSKAKVTVRRGADVYDFEIVRGVTGEARPAFFVSDALGGYGYGYDYYEYPPYYGGGGGNRLEGVKTIDINNVETPKFLPDFLKTVEKLAADADLRGIILDLRDVTGGTGETGIKVAAAFMTEGVITHQIRPSGKDSIEMVTYYVENGEVLARTRVFQKDDKNGLNVAAQPTDAVTHTGWKAGYFKGEVVVAVNENTSGAAELIAAALKNNRRGTLVGNSITFGKGMEQTYEQVSQHHVVAFTTSIYLQPDGSSIEKFGVIPHVPAQSDEWSFNSTVTQVMEQRLKVVPYPILPEKKKEDK